MKVDLEDVRWKKNSCVKPFSLGYMYNLRDNKCILEILERCSNLSLYQLFFFLRFKNHDTADNHGADFQFFLQPRNFADPQKTVIPEYSGMLLEAMNLADQNQEP